MKRVTIIQRTLYHHRVDFYRKLKSYLLQNGIELQLIVGENQNHDTMDFLDHFIIKENWHLRFFKFKEELIYQPYLPFLKKSDLIILELGNRLLLNYILILRRLLQSPRKIAFWGHVLNLQVNLNNFRNILKKTYFNNVDCWFPYTEGMAEILKKSGFPSERTTVIYNTTDTEKILRLKKTISNEYIGSLRRKLNIISFPVGIFCGRMYKEKRIGFLLQACQKIKEELPGFTMIFIGDGEDGYMVRDLSQQYHWIKYIGSVYDSEKTAYFKLADAFLCPGLVGMSVTDGFVLEVPLITTDYCFHSPEIEYLKNGENGVITKNNLDDYVREVINIFRHKEYLDKLKEGCREASKKYTVNNMVSRMTGGIKRCLGLS